MTSHVCRHCSAPQEKLFLDLGHAPPSNSYVPLAAANNPEITYPLKLRVCEKCWLVQTEDYTKADQLFDADYAYFSSTSQSWLKHAAEYSSMIIDRLALTADSSVIEVASNDGYLLRNFIAAGVPCLGIEPTDSTAEAAEALGIPVIREFFGEQLGKRLAAEGKSVDLIIGNNVYAHVPDIRDFTLGLSAVLKKDGVITLEFPHLMRLVEFCQFDTVYHEHFSYLSLIAVTNIFATAGLRIFDVEELSTHGGSLRVYGCHSSAIHSEKSSVKYILGEEVKRGMNNVNFYSGFQSRVETLKNNFLQFLIEAKKAGKQVVAYGAAAKGNTLLNYAGVKADLVPFVCDAAPSKQNKLMPGSHIPILSPEVLENKLPDYLLILPWNIKNEIKGIYADLSKNGTRFVTAVPEMIIE